MSTEAMKLALEALKQIDEAMPFPVAKLAQAALREALAEQPAQQEPVEWGVDWGRAGDIPCVSIIKRLPDGRIEVVAVEYGPQRTWVGLTDEQIEDIWADCPIDWDDQINILTFARAIEAAHGIKENT
jgi:hypothetical protein